MVNITAVEGDVATFEADAIVVTLFDGVTSPIGEAGAVDKALDGAITTLIADKEITGKQGELAMVHTLGKLPAKRVVVLGLGKREKFTADTVKPRLSEPSTLPQNVLSIGATPTTSLWSR